MESDHSAGEQQNCEWQARAPEELGSSDPDVLRAALIRENTARRRAECLASMQAEVVQLALTQLIQHPGVEGFFGALTKTIVDDGEGYACGVWVVDEDSPSCRFWMAYVKDQLFTDKDSRENAACGTKGDGFPCPDMAAHLFDYRPGWTETVQYAADDPRLPRSVREFTRANDLDATIATPLVLGDVTLGWMTVTADRSRKAESDWWRLELIEAIARQAALALHHSRLVERVRAQERRKAILEERNRLARDIHDNLAQGFAAILMQLQGVPRAACAKTPSIASPIETAIELARTHLAEARRSVGTLRPNVGSGEDVAASIRRLADLAQRTSRIPVDVIVDELPRAGDGVEREIVSIMQEALTNAVRHADARRITVRASAIQSLGLRISIADDGRGIAGDRATSGFGMTSMQERADKIGASLTIVTAPRSGTEVVLAWEPTSLPMQVHVAG